MGSDLITLLSPRPPAVLFVNGGGAVTLPFYGPSSYRYERTQTTAEVLDAETAGNQGLAWAAARAGVGAFIGGFGPLTDENSAQFGIEFYRRVFAGNSVAQAFWTARRDLRRRVPEAYFFVMNGYPDLDLCKPKPA